MSSRKTRNHWLSTLAFCLSVSLFAVPSMWADEHCACECVGATPLEVCRGVLITTARETAECTAALQCAAPMNQFAVLSDGDIKLPATSLTGNVHGNGKVDISGSSRIIGNVSTSQSGVVNVGKNAQVTGAINDDGGGGNVIKVRGAAEVIGSATTGADEVEVLTFDEMLEQLDTSSLPYTYYSGDLTIETGMTGIFIVEGDARFSRFVGRATVIARGNIEFGGDSQITAVLQSESQFPGGLALFGRDVSVHGSVTGTIIATHNLNLAALK